MHSHLTFIIPVRHPDNARDLNLSKLQLAQTLKSIASQTILEWDAVVVANRGADLPELPPGVRTKFVDFPANPLHERGMATEVQFYASVRLDKGRRVLAGILDAKPAGHLMVVDDDDFVSSRLAAHVRDNSERAGWFFKHGYVWSGGNLIFLHSDFARLCGTSHIIRANLLKLPDSLEEAESNYIQRMLGSHVLVQDDLLHSGVKLEALPFPGAVYRVGHTGAHSRSSGIIRQYFLKKSLFLSPHTAIARLVRLRYLSSSIRREFSVGASR